MLRHSSGFFYLAEEGGPNPIFAKQKGFDDKFVARVHSAHRFVGPLIPPPVLQ